MRRIGNAAQQISRSRPESSIDQRLPSSHFGEQLSSGWGNFRPHLTEANLLGLRWCAQAVENEQGISHSDLQSLMDLINEFKSRVEQDAFPEHVRKFVLHQLELLSRAVKEYPIRGRAAAVDALKQAAVEALSTDDETTATVPKTYRDHLAGGWRSLMGAGEATEKMIKLATAPPVLIWRTDSALVDGERAAVTRIRQ